MRVISLNVGQAQTLEVGQQSVQTGIFKQAVIGALELGELGFAGDVQVNKRFHGGPDKAVCAYPSEHFTHWAGSLGKTFGPGAFGENLTLAGALETGVHIGDVFRLGDASLQITQPRQPCATLAARHQQADFVKLVAQAGMTGWYFRVLEVGRVQVDDALERTSLGEVSVFEAMMTMLRAKTQPDRPAIERLRAQPALSHSWQESLDAILAKLEVA